MKQIKIGIFGAGRGTSIAKNFMLLNCEIVALCDNRPDRLAEGAKALGSDVVLYDSFDRFIEHEMDAVVIANHFHEHTPYVLKCFERGIHVFCECTSNGTMAEGVELVRAYEKTSSIFMLAENYPRRIFNTEAKRICDSGTLGKILYAEGEYNHPVGATDSGFSKRYIYTEKHWRNYLPRTYYITHSLGPVMWVTGATPKRVTAFASFAPIEGPTARHCGDRVAQVLTQNDDGSVFRVTGCAGYGAHHNSYRFCGTKGQVENLRGMGSKVMLRYNEWDRPEGMPTESLYEPIWDDPDRALIEKSGHGGGDYLTAREFLNCIRENRQPGHPFDLHSAVTMASVGILAHRSSLEGGMPYDIPDFHLKADRQKYENDRLSPFYGEDGSEPTMPCCSHPDYKPTDEQIRGFREMMKS